MLEAVVEHRLYSRVKRMGGKCIKLAPTIAGLPDRMVLLPGGRVYFVELKRPKGGKVSPIQTVRHAEFELLGHPVAVLWTREAVDEWVRGVSEE